MSSVRQVSALLAALAIATLPMAPVVHVHEAHDAEGSHHAVAHSHAQAHHHHHDDEDAAPGGLGMDDMDEEDSVVLSVSPVFALPHASTLRAPAVTRSVFVQTPEPRVVVRARDFVERLIHAPPRAPSPLRGPPSSTLL